MVTLKWFIAIIFRFNWYNFKRLWIILSWLYCNAESTLLDIKAFLDDNITKAFHFIHNGYQKLMS